MSLWLRAVVPMPRDPAPRPQLDTWGVGASAVLGGCLATHRSGSLATDVCPFDRCQHESKLRGFYDGNDLVFSAGHKGPGTERETQPRRGCLSPQGTTLVCPVASTGPRLGRAHGWDAPGLSQLPRGPQHPAAIIADSDSLTVDTGRRLRPGLTLLRPVPQGREFGLKRKSCSEHVLDTGGDTDTPAQQPPPPNFSFCAFAQDFLCGMPGPICSRKFLPVFSFFEIEIEIIHTL